MLKALICTNHMASIGGSEMVALEIAEAFKKNNYLVDIVANYIGSPFSDIVRNSSINLLTTDDLPNPFDYDIVWAQHQVLPILVNHHIDSFNNKTYFIFTHLSPYEHLETLGLYTERLLANKIFANSKETFNQLCNFGLPTNISDILFNASPSEFFREKNTAGKTLKNILLVSNHPPEEILNAMEILKNKYSLNVVNIGVRGNTERLTPKMIEDSDAVITIGKTVQYAIVGDTPVYCYDHFGGIGWLLINNYKKAEDFNYSGRCCLRKISECQIIEEILVGYERAKEEIHKIRDEVSAKYCLDFYIKDIIKASKLNITSRVISSDDCQKIKSESEIVKSIKQYYNAYNQLSIKYNDTSLRINELSSNNEKLISENNIVLEKFNKLTMVHNELISRLSELTSNNEQLILENNIVLEKFNKLTMAHNELISRFSQLTSNNEQLISENNIILGKFNESTSTIDNLLIHNARLLSDNSINLEKYDALLGSYNKLESRYLKYKNTFLKKLARRIKKLYNKNVY
jgi:CHASE3 domain sensor protein